MLISNEDAMAEAFPAADAGVQPYGSRVLVQIRTPKTVSEGGIYIPSNSRDTEKWNTQVAKVISLGPLAYKNRNTAMSWPEGDWCKPNDFVRVPKYGGDRWEVTLPKKKSPLNQPLLFDSPKSVAPSIESSLAKNAIDGEEPALFVIFNDLDIIGKVTGDPLAIKAFI